MATSPTSSPRRPKAKKGTVQIKISHERLQLVFSWQGQRYYLSLGVPDTVVNRKAAEQKARQIELDFVSGNFDPTLDEYRPEHIQKGKAQGLTSMRAIWAQYLAYKSPHVSPKTINSTYDPVTAHLDKCRTDGLKDPIKFRRELLQVTTESQARRTLMQLSAACKWGMKHRLVDSNPFEGMYLDLAATQPTPPMAFTVEERDQIIAAFETDSRPGINYRHYAPFVKFLFWTGCRPCEAIGLRWGSVTPDCSRVHFHESVVEVSGRLERRIEDKTNVKRWFSCPKRLKELLQSVRPDAPDAEALVFQSPKGKTITESNFADRAWTQVLTKVGLAVKDNIKMTPYNCRDTFITLQALQGHSSTTIARWVGNSSEVIEKRYLDKMKLDHLKPTDI